VAEGPKLLAEAVDCGAPIDTVFLDSEAAGPGPRDLARRAAEAGAVVVEAAPGALARACESASPQPVAAIIAMGDVTLVDTAAGPSPIVVAVGLQDPGNAGAVLRSAAASGAGGAVFCEGCVDLYHPKSVRASAGAVFRLRFTMAGPPESVLREVGALGLFRWATAARLGEDYTSVDLVTPAALVLGNEASGLPADLDGLIDGRLTIPLAGGMESLNVAMAAAVLCFEAARQRRAAA